MLHKGELAQETHDTKNILGTQKYLETFLTVMPGEEVMLPASNGWRTGVLLNTLQRVATTKNYPVPNASSVEVDVQTHETLCYPISQIRDLRVPR